MTNYVKNKQDLNQKADKGNREKNSRHKKMKGKKRYGEPGYKHTQVTTEHE